MWSNAADGSDPGADEDRRAAHLTPTFTIDEDRPGVRRATKCCSPAGALTAGSDARTLPGITSVPARMSSATPEPDEAQTGRASRRRGCPGRSRGTGRATPAERGQGRPVIETVEECPRDGRSGPAGLPPRSGGWRRASRDRAHRVMCAIGSAVWLERCFSRQRSRWIPTPELGEIATDGSREPASGGSCQLLPGAMAVARPHEPPGLLGQAT